MPFVSLTPPLPHPLLARERVADWLADPRPQAFVLVAGPGAGKSYAAQTMADALGLPAVWLGPAAEGQSGAVSGDLEALERWLTDRHPAGAMVVFDAVEGMGEAAAGFLQRWLAGPHGPHVTVVTSRRALLFSLARSLAYGHVKALGPVDLFLTPAEEADWLDRAEAPPNAAGWPLGAHALRALGSRPGAEALLRELAAAEWIDLLPEAWRAAAMRLAITEAPSAVAALIDQGDDVLAGCEAWGLMQADAWHPLAREVLTARWARETMPDEQTAWRRLVGERVGPDAAIGVLLDGGLVAEAIAVLRRAGKALLLAGEHDRLAGWLKRFPPEAWKSEPALALAEGAIAQAKGAFAEAEARYRQALAAARSTGDRATTFEALGDLLHLYWTHEALDALREVAAEAAQYEPDAVVAERVEYWNNLACHHFGAGEEEEAERLFKHALDYPHLRDPQIASVQQFAAINLGILQMERGDFDEAERTYRHVLALAAEFPLKPSVPRGATLYLAMTALRRGDRAQAEGWMQALAALPDPPQDPYRQGEFAMLEGDYALLTGQFAEAERRYRAALAAFATLGMDTNADAGAATSRLAVIHRRRGELEAAKRLHAQALALVAPWPRDRAKVLLEWATTLMVEGDTAGAGERLAEAAPPWGELRAYHVEAATGLARAVWAERQGLGEDAEAHLALALKLVRRGPYYYTAIAQRELAPDLWALLARTGQLDVLSQVEAHFPTAAAGIRAELAGRQSVLPPVAAPAMAVRCFGELEVRVADAPVVAWPRKKAKALLASLVLAPNGLSREELAERLFPDLGWDEGQHQLDVMVSTLRKALEPALERRQRSRYLTVKDKRYSLERDGVSLDLEAFEQDHRAGMAAWQRGDRASAVTAFERAIGLYRGDLFAEPLLLEFFDVERHRARTQAQDMLERLAAEAFTGGHFEPARAHWERLIALDVRHEEAHRGLMRLYAHLGQPSLARQQYEVLEKVLKRELDAAPSAETRALLAKLGSG